MTDSPPLFEEMLATYPADKRELARRVYDRFANGDATEFFAQLFLLLDVYANYAKRIPQAVSETNQSTLASLKKVREEIGLLAQNVESRSLNVDNRFEETTELCLATQKKCEAAVQKVAAMITDISRQVDTKAIVENIRQAVDAGVNKEVIKPFMQRTEELSEEVLPTLKQIRSANEEAGRVWPGRIWKTSLLCGLALGLAVAIAGTTTAYLKIKRHYDAVLAEEIVSAESTLTQNKEAFQQLAVANAAIYVVRSSDASTGQPIPSGYCLYIKGAIGADMHDGEGRIFFNSGRQQEEIEEVLREAQQLIDQFNKTNKP